MHHRVNEITARPRLALAVGVLVFAAWIGIVVAGFDQDLQLAFATICGGITVTMVFVLQHTQQRAQTAVQLKLNEIVRALPHADNQLIGVEASRDVELVALEDEQLQHHASLREDGPPRTD